MSYPLLTLAQLLQDPSQAREVPTASVPALLGDLEQLRATLWARMMASTSSTDTGHAASPAEGDRLLTPETAAAILGVSPRWLYRHAQHLPFTRRLSRKTLRFSETGLRKWQAAKRGY